MAKNSKYLLLLVLPVIWGSYYVSSQQIISRTSTFSAGLGIRFLTMLTLTALMIGRKEWHTLFETKGVTGRLILIGTFGFLLDVTAFIGLSLSSAASGTALLKCDVLMVNLMSMIIYKQRFSKKAWLFTAVMLIGVFMIMGIDFRTFKIADPGNIFFLLSAFFVSCNAFLIKSVQFDKKNPVSDNVVAYYNNFVTMLFFLAASLISGSVKDLCLVWKDHQALLALVLASLGQTLVYIVYYRNLRNFEVWLVKTVLLLMPMVSMLITMILFHERMGGMQYAGMAVILTGALGILLEQRTGNAVT